MIYSPSGLMRYKGGKPPLMICHRFAMDKKIRRPSRRIFWQGQKDLKCFAPLLRCPKVVTAWSAYNFWPLRQRALPLSSTGRGRARCPARGFGGEKMRGEKSFVYWVSWSFDGSRHKLCHNTVDKIRTDRNVLIIRPPILLVWKSIRFIFTKQRGVIIWAKSNWGLIISLFRKPSLCA